MEETKLLNGFNENVKPIPDINTNKKSLSKDKEEQAPKKSYNDIFNAKENEVIKDALVKFVNYCKGKNYNPKVTTVEKFASTLRENTEVAMAMVDQSISSGWKDIYPLKKRYNGAPEKTEAVSIPVSKDDKAKNPDGTYVVY